MTPKKNINNEQLFRIADSQQGFFTIQQAAEAGFELTNVTYHVKARNWTREHRGIYRLTNYPASNQSDLVLWSLWSRNRGQVPQGVYSHHTALTIHALTDLMPAKLHMTVPKAFRRSKIPSVLSLHFQDLKAADIQLMKGFAVTKPLRTIKDLLRARSVSPEVLRQALEDALRNGLVTTAEVQDPNLGQLQDLLKTIR